MCRCLLAILALFALIACGSPAAVAPTASAPPVVTPATRPSTQALTAPVLPTQPEATAAPIQPEATAEPSEATAAPIQPEATAEPPAATAVPTQPEATPAPTQPPTPTLGAGAERELLFLRDGALVALTPSTGALREIADAVLDFAVSPDASTIALVRGAGAKGEIWTVRRDGSKLVQLSKNSTAEATLAWAPDGLSLIFSASSGATAYARDWAAWSAWCATSEIHELTLADGREASLARGCDPAISPDGKRIAFATPATQQEQGDTSGALISNTIRLINRKGQNGWDFAKATGPDAAAPNTGRVLYAPAWSPSGAQIVYQRFLGYQALVDIDLTQIAASFKGGGEPVGSGAGWLLPVQFAPGGQLLAISENNYSDARGFGGYDNWRVTIIRLEGTHEIAMPSGSLTAQGQQVDQLMRAQQAIWQADGAALVVQLPPGWKADLPIDQPLGVDEQPGELWLWTPGRAPAQRLADKVDFASPLAWL